MSCFNRNYKTRSANGIEIARLRKPRPITACATIWKTITSYLSLTTKQELLRVTCLLFVQKVSWIYHFCNILGSFCHYRKLSSVEKTLIASKKKSVFVETDDIGLRTTCKGSVIFSIILHNFKFSLSSFTF